MRRLLTMAVVATIWSAAPRGHSQPPQDRWSTAEKTGYAVGHDLGTQSLDRLRADGIEVDLASFVSGFADAVRGAEPRLSSAELEAVLARLEREVTTRAAEQRMASDPVFRALAEANLSKSRAFQEEFGSKTGVTTLSTGIQYEVIVRGSGGRVAPDGTVVVAFKGKLLDGYVFGPLHPAAHTLHSLYLLTHLGQFGRQRGESSGQNIRLIACLRDPCHRAIQRLKPALQVGRATTEIDDALADCLEAAALEPESLGAAPDLFLQTGELLA